MDEMGVLISWLTRASIGLPDVRQRALQPLAHLQCSTAHQTDLQQHSATRISCKTKCREWGRVELLEPACAGVPAGTQASGRSVLALGP